jgi:hypothetical protein
MENNVEDFIEEYDQDKRLAIDHVEMFKTRIERRIKKLAIVDVEYYYENEELLGKAKLECYDEVEWLNDYMLKREEYECCAILKDIKLSVERVYNQILKDKIIQTTE